MLFFVGKIVLVMGGLCFIGVVIVKCFVVDGVVVVLIYSFLLDCVV